MTTKFINQVFWQSIVPMALTDGPKGTFLEVNEAFLKRFGFSRKEIIGNTVVKTGLVTYKESLAFRKEVREKGCAKNILMKLRTQNDQIHFITINTIPIAMKEKVYWLNIGTDTSSFNSATKTLQNDIIKIFDSYENGGVIVINVYKRRKVSLLYANEEAKNILKKYSLNQLIHKLEDKELAYLNIEAESYYVTKVGNLDSSHMQLIVMHKFPRNINFKQIFQESSFTSRQQEVALLAATGNSNSQIAKKLFISEYTVKDHLKEIFRLLGIHNRSELLPKLLNLR